jgi:hypothetical protein
LAKCDLFIAETAHFFSKSTQDGLKHSPVGRPQRRAPSPRASLRKLGACSIEPGHHPNDLDRFFTT